MMEDSRFAAQPNGVACSNSCGDSLALELGCNAMCPKAPADCKTFRAQRSPNECSNQRRSSRSVAEQSKREPGTNLQTPTSRIVMELELNAPFRDCLLRAP